MNLPFYLYTFYTFSHPHFFTFSLYLVALKLSMFSYLRFMKRR